MRRVFWIWNQTHLDPRHTRHYDPIFPFNKILAIISKYGWLKDHYLVGGFFWIQLKYFQSVQYITTVVIMSCCCAAVDVGNVGACSGYRTWPGHTRHEREAQIILNINSMSSIHQSISLFSIHQSFSSSFIYQFVPIHQSFSSFFINQSICPRSISHSVRPSWYL